MQDKLILEYTDLRVIIRELKSYEGNYIGEFYKAAKNIGKPVQDTIRRAIPATAPLSGMRARSERGRLAWNIGKRAKTVTIKANRTVRRGSSFAKGKTNEYPIVQVIASAPAFVLADMAGKTNAYTNNKPRSRAHQIDLFGRGEIVERTYKMEGQGVALIDALNKGVKGGDNKASRWFWPAAEKGMEKATDEMEKLLNDTIDMINQRLGT